MKLCKLQNVSLVACWVPPMVEVPAVLPGFSQKAVICGTRDTLSPFPRPVSLPVRSAVALLQLLEGWAGTAVPPGTHRGCPWKHSRAHGAANCKLRRVHREKACPGSPANRSRVTASGRGDPHATQEPPHSPGMEGMQNKQVPCQA